MVAPTSRQRGQAQADARGLVEQEQPVGLAPEGADRRQRRQNRRSVG
jgi:hypothetical protein